MCGIYGIWRRDGGAVDVHAVERATTALRHRGPDDEGYLLANASVGIAKHYGGKDTDRRLQAPNIRSARGEHFDVALGFRRLSILDLTPLGHQPMTTPDGRYWLVFNGEIYNYRDLRSELAAMGHAFRSNSDSEVLLAAYAQWGEKCLDRFNGMWALAIWDTRDRALFLARDRFGVKPLHYVDRPGVFAFASEIKGLVGDEGAAFEPRAQAVYDYVAFGRQPDPATGHTFCEGVRALPAGCWMRVRRDDARTHRYYDLRSRPRSLGAVTEAERVDAFRDLLADSVRLRLHADVPVGTCLSGGLDSSSIVMLANRFLHDAGADVGSRQKTFSAVYDGSGKFDERVYAEKIVAASRADAHFVVPTAERLAAEADRMIWHQEEPFGGTSVFAQWCVMARAREAGVTVLLDGQGADEALGGYVPFDVQIAELAARGRLVGAIRELRAAHRTMDIPFVQTIAKALVWLMPGTLRRLASRTRARDGLAVLAPDFAREYRGSAMPHGKRSDLAEHLYDEVDRNLPELLRYEDRNSMAFHIEARVPFVDYRVMEFCFSEGRDLRIRNGWTKYLLRRAMEQLLPATIAWRRDKIGFETPEDQWLPVFLRARRDEFQGPLAMHAYVDATRFRSDVSTAVETGRVSRLLWRLVNLELWMRAWRQTPRARLDARQAVGV